MTRFLNLIRQSICLSHISVFNFLPRRLYYTPLQLQSYACLTCIGRQAHSLYAAGGAAKGQVLREERHVGVWRGVLRDFEWGRGWVHLRMPDHDQYEWRIKLSTKSCSCSPFMFRPPQLSFSTPSIARRYRALPLQVASCLLFITHTT